MKTVLIVDDVYCIRTVVETMIKSLHPKAVFVHAAHGAHAWEVINKPGQHFDLVVTDNKMPVMGGKELVDKISATYPKTRVILMSCTTEPVAHKAHAFVRKPMPMSKFMDVIRRVMEQPI